MSDLPIPPCAPGPDEARPFWSAAEQSTLRFQRCRGCRSTVWIPRAACPSCGGSDLEWEPSRGVGTVYSHTTSHRGPGEYRGAPFCLAYVSLDEGFTVLTHIVGIDPSEVFVDLRVRAVFEKSDDPDIPTILRFEPVHHAAVPFASKGAL